MLRFIKGGAGTGKSTFIRNEIKDFTDNNKKIILIVPEQFLFESEREYYNLLGIEKSQNVKVLSFNRLCDDVFRLYGGVAGNYASETVEILAMREALRECKDSLALYEKNYIKPDFIISMLNVLKEMKNAGINHEILGKQAEKTEKGILKDKLSDFSLIFGSYEALLTQKFSDPSNLLTRAKELISENGYFNEHHVYFDEFSNFTGIQKQIISLALKQAESVNISLCIPEGNDEYGIFDILKDAEKSIKAMAYKDNCKVLPPVIFEKPLRFANQELAHFGNEALKNNPVPFIGKNNAVSCFGLLNEFDETEFVASKISELVKESGYRFEDIVVIGRNLEDYSYIIESVFEKYGIPYFFDYTDKVYSMPLIRFVNHLLGAVITGMSKKELIPMLKCGLMPFTLSEINDFEKYIFVWNIDKDSFRNEFVQNPKGFSEFEMSRHEKTALKNAEKVRSFCIKLLESFRKTAEETSSVGKAIYNSLLELSLPSVISERIKNAKSVQLSEDEKRVWDVLMEILDALEVSFSDKKLNFREYKEMFSLSASGYKLTRRPQTLDSVLIGSAERIRVNGKKAVIIIGANDKIFPFVPTSGGMLTDAERKSLTENGLEVYNLTSQRLIDERFVAYKALTSASEKLIITYPFGDIGGTEKYPSVLISGFKKVFPDTPVIYQKNIDRSYFCHNLSTVFHHAAKVGHNAEGNDAVFYATAKELFKNEKVYRAKLKKLENIFRDELVLTDRSLCSELFDRPVIRKRTLTKKAFLPKNTSRHFSVREKDKFSALSYRTNKLSPSQVEKYYTCPFQHFMSYGLGLYSPGKAELNPLSRGNVIHYILDNIIKNHDIVSLSDTELKEITDHYLDEYLNRVMGGEKEKTQKFLYFYRKLRYTLHNIFTALRDEFSQTEFKVTGLEEVIREGGEITPISLSVDENHGILVTGKIDRVDMCSIKDENFVRIIDYKSGSKTFDVSQMAMGLNLQMLLYLFAIWRTNNEKYKNITPAGILYMPAGNPSPALSREADQDDLKKAKQKSFVMNGLLLDNERVLTAMEKDLDGKFLPVSKVSGDLKGKQLASIEEFEAIEEYTKNLVREMGSRLLNGDISPDPVKTDRYSPCAYCDYVSICGREMNEACREVETKTLKDITGNN